MQDATALGALAGVHHLLLKRVEDLAAGDYDQRFDVALPSAGWLLGRAVYLELHLLRGLVQGDREPAERARDLFAGDDGAPGRDARLPPRQDLLGWAREQFDRGLADLAEPGRLPPHPLLDDGWLAWFLAQRLALVYERLLATLSAGRARHRRGDYRVSVPLRAQQPRHDSVRIEQGRYRVGTAGGAAMANEQPPQAVDLQSFRIARRPVGNAEYLAFIEDGGYRELGWWDQDGRAWLQATEPAAPWLWRRDHRDRWYGIGVDGATDLAAEAPVAGICAHEARAFATWAAARGDGLAGAVIQHEYQWEVAARLGAIDQRGRSWEWCANAFHPYPGYRTPPDPELEPGRFDGDHLALRGGCLHSQPSLRRIGFRLCLGAGRREGFAGARLVLPPGNAAWE